MRVHSIRSTNDPLLCADTVRPRKQNRVFEVGHEIDGLRTGNMYDALLSDNAKFGKRNTRSHMHAHMQTFQIILAVITR